MRLADFVHGFGEVIAPAVEAGGYDFGAPMQKPTELPWVFVTWTTSTPTATTYNYRDPVDGKLKARGKKRTHTGVVYVLLAQSGSVDNEDAMAIEAAQDVMDAVDDDTTLRGLGAEDRVARATMGNIDRYRFEWEGISYAGVQVEWNALEI